MVLLAFLLTPVFLSASAFAQKCRQPAEYIAAVQNFGKLLIEPDLVINGNVSSPWSPGVIGRVDVTTNFIGEELNNEYLFGLFSQAGLENTTQIIDKPVNTTVVELVVQPPMVYVSVIIEFLQRTIDVVLPIQTDFLLRFDENLLISSYDATIRRFPQASKYIIPKLAVKMAQELNMTISKPTDIQEVVTKRAAIDICTVERDYCKGSDKQYENYNACLEFLTSTVPFGDPWEGGLNTTWCRYIHKNMVKFRPDIHCPHIGPSGGGMCIDRDYNEIVYKPPFNESLIASSAECSRAY